jgi:hypothetical protein
MFKATNGQMTIGRTGQTATLLFDGRVLLAGGASVVIGTGLSLSTAELYDPISQTFTQTFGTMSDGRDVAAAVRLCDGRVLIAGGLGSANSTVATADLYDPSSGKFTPTKNKMDYPRVYLTSTLLPNCEVLIDGGVDSNSTVLPATAELFDPVSETFRTTKGNPVMPRWLHTATLLSTPMFAGTPGKANCHGQSISALAQQYGGPDAAASALGFPSVQALQNAIRTF